MGFPCRGHIHDFFAEGDNAKRFEIQHIRADSKGITGLKVDKPAKE